MIADTNPDTTLVDSGSGISDQALFSVVVDRCALSDTSTPGTARPGGAFDLVSGLTRLEQQYQRMDHATDQPERLVDITVVDSPQQAEQQGDWTQQLNQASQLNEQLGLSGIGASAHRLPESDSHQGLLGQRSVDLYIGTDPRKAQEVCDTGTSAVWVRPPSDPRSFAELESKQPGDSPLSCVFDADNVILGRLDEDAGHVFYSMTKDKAQTDRLWRSWQMEMGEQAPGKGPLAPLAEFLVQAKEQLGQDDATEVHILTARSAEGNDRLGKLMDDMGLRTPDGPTGSYTATGGSRPKPAFLEGPLSGYAAFFDDHGIGTKGHGDNFAYPNGGPVVRNGFQVCLPSSIDPATNQQLKSVESWAEKTLAEWGMDVHPTYREKQAQHCDDFNKILRNWEPAQEFSA